MKLKSALAIVLVIELSIVTVECRYCPNEEGLNNCPNGDCILCYCP